MEKADSASSRELSARERDDRLRRRRGGAGSRSGFAGCRLLLEAPDVKHDSPSLGRRYGVAVGRHYLRAVPDGAVDGAIFHQENAPRNQVGGWRSEHETDRSVAAPARAVTHRTISRV